MNKTETPMNYTITKRSSYPILQLNQTLSPETYFQILGSLKQPVSEPQNSLIVDFSNLDFLNSTGVNLLLSLVNGNKRKVVLLNPSTQVKKILSITKLDSLFSYFTDMNDAIRHFDN